MYQYLIQAVKAKLVNKSAPSLLPVPRTDTSSLTSVRRFVNGYAITSTKAVENQTSNCSVMDSTTVKLIGEWSHLVPKSQALGISIADSHASVFSEQRKYKPIALESGGKGTNFA